MAQKVQLPVDEEFGIEITKFQPLKLEKGAVFSASDFTMSGPDQGQNANVHLTQGSHQKNNPKFDVPVAQRGPATTIRVDCAHAVISIRLSPDNFVPTGIAFYRADGTKPVAVPCPPRPTKGSPFSQFQVDGSRLEFTDMPKFGTIQHPKTGQHVTYGYVIYFQDRITGAHGFIDPEVENDD